MAKTQKAAFYGHDRPRNALGHDPDYVHDGNYKSLDDYLDDLAVFSETFNIRPDKKGYFSEKVLTQLEKENYEQAIKILRQSFQNL